MKTIKFSNSKPEIQQIARIARRAVKMASKANCKYAQRDAEMDIAALHCNGHPLDLEKLENADDWNFAHDVFGIRRHLNRSTGELENHFSPRCTKLAKAA